MELKVLILEDVDADAELVLREFKKAGLTVIPRRAKTKESFLTEISESLPPDVILADYNLPRFTGMEAFRILKDRGLDVPFIIVTGALSEEVAVECMKEGISDFILKTSLKRLPSAVVGAYEKWVYKRDREKALASLRDSEERFRVIAETANDAIVGLEAPDTVNLWNKKAEEMFGYTAVETLGRELHKIIVPERYRPNAYRGLGSFFNTGQGQIVGRTVEFYAVRKDGSEFPIELSISAMKIRGEWQATGIVRDITERKQAEEALRKSEERYRRITETITDYIYTVRIDNGRAVETIHAPSCIAVTGFSTEEFVADPHLWLNMVPEEDRSAVMEFAQMVQSGKSVHPIEHRITRKDGVVRWVRNTPVLNYSADGKKLISYDGLIQDITERKLAEERLKEEMNVTSNLLKISEATSRTMDADKLMEHVVESNCKIMGARICLTYWWDREARLFRPNKQVGLSHGLVHLFVTELLDREVRFVKMAVEVNEPIIIEEFQKIREENVLSWMSDIHTMVVTPLTSKRRNLGLLISAYDFPRKFNDWDRKVMRGIAGTVSIALDQANLYAESMDRAMELSHKMETIQVMHEVDKSLLSTLEPQAILETVVRMVSRIVSCDGTAVILLDTEKKGFIYKAGYGLPYVSEGVGIPFKDTLATEVVETGMPQYIANLAELRDLPALEDGLLKEGFLSHIRMPLIVKNEVVGILTVESKRGVAFTSGDLSTLEKLASQIGVALQNAKQVTDLEELLIGTVKSLSSAMDAKSHWTAGHSERVTRYALAIADEMGLTEREMKDLELAALLHDIGKIGTDEAILDKTNILTKEELDIMRRHPGKGIDILSPVRRLKEVIPAIEHHHEYYNGLGYPDGLKSDEIPLLARILAVADSVDAMGSDRPYRKGKAMDLIIAELKKCSGNQFDPKVVEAFLKVVGKLSPV